MASPMSREKAIVLLLAAGRIRVAEFDESKHPRDEKGQFTSLGESLKDTLNHYQGIFYTTLDDAKALSEKIPGSIVLKKKRGFVVSHVKHGLFGPKGFKALEMRSLAARNALIDAADALEPKFSVAIRAAFAVARKKLPDVEATVTALESALRKVLEPLLRKGLEAGGEAAAARLTGAAFDESKHPRVPAGSAEGGEFASEGGGENISSGKPSSTKDVFKFPKDFKLEDAQYNVDTKFPLDKMVVAEVDQSLINSPYPKDWRVQQMMDAIEGGARFPPITLQQYVDPDQLTIEDGNTRIAALRELGIKGSVPAVIRLYGDGTPLPKGVVIDEERTASLRRGKGPTPKSSAARLLADRPKLHMQFNASDPRAIAWAKRHAAELVTEIGRTTRERLKQTVASHQAGDLTDKEFSDRLESAVGDEARAETIARTESMLAVHQGQREAWAQAVDEGLLPEGVRRTWIVTPDDKLCPICEPLDGEEADLDGLFAGEFDGPPAHPNCRCTEGLA